MADQDPATVNPQTVIVYGDERTEYSSAYDEEQIEITVLRCLARYGAESNPQPIPNLVPGGNAE
jgi:hypothetical protein